MGLRTGSNSRLTIWKEATFNTLPAAAGSVTGYNIPVIEGANDLSWWEEKGNVNELLSNLNPPRPVRGFHRSGGNIVMPVERKSIGLMFKKFMSSYAVSGTGGGGDPYVHVFKISGDPGSFGAEVWNTAEARGDYVHGLVLAGFSVTAAKQPQELQISWSVQGSGKCDLDQTTAADSSPETFTDERFEASDTSVYVGGSLSTLIESMELNVTRDVSLLHVMDGLMYAKYQLGHRYTVTGRITGLWDQASTIRAMATGATEQALKFVFPHPSNADHKLEIYIDEAMCFLDSAQNWSNRDALRTTISFEGYYQDDADASACYVKLYNNYATYTSDM